MSIATVSSTLSTSQKFLVHGARVRKATQRQLHAQTTTRPIRGAWLFEKHASSHIAHTAPIKARDVTRCSNTRSMCVDAGTTLEAIDRTRMLPPNLEDRSTSQATRDTRDTPSLRTARESTSSSEPAKLDSKPVEVAQHRPQPRLALEAADSSPLQTRCVVHTHSQRRQQATPSPRCAGYF